MEQRRPAAVGISVARVARMTWVRPFDSLMLAQGRLSSAGRRVLTIGRFAAHSRSEGGKRRFLGSVGAQQAPVALGDAVVVARVERGVVRDHPIEDFERDLCVPLLGQSSKVDEPWRFCHSAVTAQRSRS